MQEGCELLAVLPDQGSVGYTSSSFEHRVCVLNILANLNRSSKRVPASMARKLLLLRYHGGGIQQVSRQMRQYAVIANIESERSDHYTMSTLPLHVTLLSLGLLL